MTMEQKIQLGRKEAEKAPVPLLVVGLGGAGCEALAAVKQKFAERYILPKDKNGRELPVSPDTAFLGIDALGQRPEGLDFAEYTDIVLPGLDRILSNPKELLTPHEQTWMDREVLSHGLYPFRGGGNRQLARLAMSRNYDRIFEAIRGALCRMTEGRADGADARIRIAVVTSVCGATGSGIFLDVCQILREAVREALPAYRAGLTGYILMPDVILSRIGPDSFLVGAIRRNSYAALKELDFWMRVREHRVPYTMEYGSGKQIRWDKPPFDRCYLMSGTDAEGIPRRNPTKAAMDTIAECLAQGFERDGRAQGQDSCPVQDDWQMPGLTHTCPAFYGYRAIGAAARQIPKERELYYEASLLLKTFMPPRDDRLFTDGQGKARAESITGSGKQMMQDFRTNICGIPDFCFTDLTDRVKAASIQNMDPPPHSEWHGWRDRVCAPAALKAAEDYLNRAWERFTDFARGVITDPEQGPLALKAWLGAADGLPGLLDEIRMSWYDQYTKIRNQMISQAEEMCGNAWPAFRNPPILGRRGALEQYDHALKALYTYADNEQFLEKHLESLDRLIRRVKEYLKDGLEPLCDALLLSEKEFNAEDTGDDLMTLDLCSLSDVQADMDEAFRTANEEGRLSRDFLARIAEIPMQNRASEDAKTSGVEFTCRRTVLKDLCAALQEELGQAFGSVNNRSLDDVMRVNAGDDPTARQKWMADLACSVLDSAKPLFMLNPTFRNEPRRNTAFLYIPSNAVEHRQFIPPFFATHSANPQFRESSQGRRLFCMNVWDGLPLYHYALFEYLRKAYDDGLNRPFCAGLHLVQNGGPEADYRTDWSRLPSPMPYFLPGESSPAAEEAEYRKVQELVKRAAACGMLRIQARSGYVGMRLDVFRKADGETLMTGEELKQCAEAACRDSAGNPRDPAWKRNQVAELIDNNLDEMNPLGDDIRISLAELAKLPGLEREPCDPSDPAARNDPEQLEKARENNARLGILAAEAVFCRRPDLVEILKTQIEGYEALRNAAGPEGEDLW